MGQAGWTLLISGRATPLIVSPSGLVQVAPAVSRVTSAAISSCYVP